jgi:site-specific DNA recombinase
MLTAAKAGKFDLLLIDELSRFSRDVIESEQAIRGLEFYKIRIVTADGYDSTARSRKLHRGMKALMNAEYIDVIRHETHRGLEGAALKGLSVGGRSYGYTSIPILSDDGRNTGSSHVIVEDQAEIIREVFRLYADGRSPRHIANDLNGRGVPSPGSKWKRSERRRDGKWLASAICGDPKRGVGILNNDLYRGMRVWNRSQRSWNPEAQKNVFLARPKSEHVVVPVPHLRIVDQSLWDRVKARQVRRTLEVGDSVRKGLERKRKPGAGGPPRYLFSGLLKCGACGANLTVTGQYQSYVCATHTNGGKNGCANDLTVQRVVVEDRLLKAIREDLASDEYFKWFHSEMRRIRRERSETLGRDRAAREAHLTKLRAEVANLVDAIATGSLRSSPALAARLSATEVKLASLESQAIADDAEMAKVAELLPRVSDRYKTLLANLGTALRRNVVAARDALRALIGDSVVVRPAADRKHLVAEISVVEMAQRLGNSGNIIMVAGVGFEPTTFGL